MQNKINALIDVIMHPAGCQEVLPFSLSLSYAQDYQLLLILFSVKDALGSSNSGNVLDFYCEVVHIGLRVTQFTC